MSEQEYKATGDCAVYLKTFEKALEKDDWMKVAETNNGKEKEILDPSDTLAADVIGRMCL